MNVVSLFSGIGGLDLGLERAGMTVVAQSEIDPYASRVLAKHWPDVPNLGDITAIDWSTVDLPRVDLVCGGYPCQPFSLAGVRRGEGDPRHLWPHFADTLRHLRPRWALLENVPGHLSLGFGRVLGDLAELGYDCEWHCVPAAAVGAPHLRWRVFVVAHTAHPDSQGEPGDAVDAVPRPRVLVPDTDGDAVRQQSVSVGRGGGAAVARHDGGDRDVADADDPRLQGHRPEHGLREDRPQEQAGRRRGDAGTATADAADADWWPQGAAAETARPDGVDQPRRAGRGDRPCGDWWAVEPDVGRVAHGIPNRVDRLRTLGNAVVPQVAELIGRRIMRAVDAAA